MRFNLRLFKNTDEKEMIRFLNSKARSFYQSKHTFYTPKFESYFKSNLQVAMVDIERTIRGVFGCDIFSKYADKEMLCAMFPNGCNNIFNIKSDNGLLMFGRSLETLRNMNSHAFLCESDFDLFDNDFSHLEQQPKMHSDLKYFDGELTIAGLVFIICNFLREQSLSNLTKSDFLFSYVISGEYAIDSGERFVSQISHVNLEIPINNVESHSLEESVFGNYGKLVNKNNDRFEIRIGSEVYPTTKIVGFISDNKIIIEKGSLNKVYYENDYELTIKNTSEFIELSNKLPSFVLVDYLYATGEKTFDEKAYKAIKKNWAIVSKLNYPKFYVNKNLNVLLLPKTIADFTLISSVISDSLLKILLILEKNIYQKRIRTASNDLSSIGRALSKINVPSEIIQEVKYLRNFVAHGYLLEESLLYSGESKKYTIDFIVETLCDLVSYFDKEEEELFAMFSKIVDQLLISKICNAKYKKIIETSQKIAATFPLINYDELAVKYGFVQHSYFPTETFDKLNELVNGGIEIIEVIIDGLDDHLYFRNTDNDCDLLDEMCNKNHLKTIKEEGSSILYRYYLSK